MVSNEGEKARDTFKEEIVESISSNIQTPETLTEGETDSSTNLKISGSPSVYTQEKPIIIQVGPEKNKFFIHKGLFASKSPFFRTMFKDCWDGKKEEVEVCEVSSIGFTIVVDWVYSGQLPSRVKEYSKGKLEPWEGILHAHKAADVLMMEKLQNELIANEAAIDLKYGLKWPFYRLQQLYDNDLCHTKYYEYVLKSAIASMMSDISMSSKRWDEDIKSVENNPKVLADLLTGTRKWIQKPWKDFPAGDLTEFLI